MRVRRGGAASILAGLALVAFSPGLAAAGPVEFSAAELRGIVALGPWPPPRSRDASNRASGKPDAIELGRRLFFDPRLTPLGYIACVTCHQPDRAWTDRKPRAHGLGDVDRNTPALVNLRLQSWFGWGGSSDSLWMASLRPILDPREMDSSPAWARRVYVRVPEYACLYRRAFGSDPRTGGESDEAVLVHSAKALAAFVETLTTGRTPFDEQRDRLARGEPPGAAGYPPAALRGLKIFVGKGGCVACHQGPNLSDGSFHDTGVPWFVAQRASDTGRADGLVELQASRYGLRGRYNDDAGLRRAAAARRLAPDGDVRAEFRTPSLRNVAVTAPYMHNGSLEGLRDVVRHYSRLDPVRLQGDARELVRRLELADSEIDDLVAFLGTLSDGRGEDRGLPPQRITPCDTAATAAPRPGSASSVRRR